MTLSHKMVKSPKSDRTGHGKQSFWLQAIKTIATDTGAAYCMGGGSVRTLVVSMATQVARVLVWKREMTTTFIYIYFAACFLLMCPPCSYGWVRVSRNRKGN